MANKVNKSGLLKAELRDPALKAELAKVAKARRMSVSAVLEMLLASMKGRMDELLREQLTNPPATAK